MARQTDDRVEIATALARRYHRPGHTHCEMDDLKSAAMVGILEQDGYWREDGGVSLRNWRFRAGAQALLAHICSMRAPVKRHAHLDRYERRKETMALTGLEYDTIGVQYGDTDDTRRTAGTAAPHEVADAEADLAAALGRGVLRDAVRGMVRETLYEMAGRYMHGPAAAAFMLDELERPADDFTGNAPGRDGRNNLNITAHKLRRLARDNPGMQRAADLLDTVH